MRVGGYGYPTKFFVHHPAAPSGSVVENQRFSWRFFPRSTARYPRPLLISRLKPLETYRIFVLGESAAQGDPEPAFNFGRVLQVLLSERYPGTRFEVINTAFTAINSHAIRAIARECAALQSDLWLVYMGNNEVVGPFGAGSPFGGHGLPLPVIRASLALKSARLGQLLDDLAERLLRTGASKEGWGGMTMMLEHQVRENDPRMKRIYAGFQSNLEDILNAARSSGAKVVASTMVANLKDCPPLASLHRPDLTDFERSQWVKVYQAGIAAEEKGDFATAIARFEEAARIDDTSAELHFRWGLACLKAGKQNDARTHLERARDLDALRFRADSRLNGIIREVIAGRGAKEIRLLDAEAEFSRRSRDGIIGEEWLYEHVHFKFEGNYLLARLFADQVVSQLPNNILNCAGRKDSWISAADCAERLAVNDYSLYWAAEHIRQRLVQPPFTAQLGHAERLRRLQDELAKMRPRTKMTGLNKSATICRDALSRTEDDYVLHDLMGFLLANAGDFDGAITQWRRVNELVPHYAAAYCEAGKILDSRNRTEEAAAQFSKAVEVNPACAEAHVGLGMSFAREGRKREAAKHLREGLRLNPANSAAKSQLERIEAGP